MKADGYGHGAADAAAAALGAGASALCVATVPEALALREALGPARMIVLGPASVPEVADAREAGLELVVVGGEIPEGVPVHLKLDTGMGRWGLAELPAPGRNVVGLMSHFASADCDPDFTEQQLERFLAATEPFAHLDAPHREQRGRVALSERAARRRALRDRALRRFPVRHRPGRRRARARAALGVGARPGQAAASGRVDGVRAEVGRRAADVDRDRPGRLRGRLPARPDRNRGADRGRTAARRRDGLDGCVRGRARRASFPSGRG